MRTSQVGEIQTHVCRYKCMRTLSHRLLFFRGRYYNTQDNKNTKDQNIVATTPHNAYNIPSTGRIVAAVT